MARCLVLGLGVAGRAVARVLVELGEEVVAVDDHPTDEVREAAKFLGIDLLEHPSADRLDDLMATTDLFFPSPGIPDVHPAFERAVAHHVRLRSEFDLAGVLDTRPLVAITGTDGKTTVTTLVTQMLLASGVAASAAGNTDVPLVEAVADPGPDCFVVEASSFRLGHTHSFRPAVATWLNFAPDHLDVHRSVDAYEAAKARIWAELGSSGVAVANADDPVVMRHLPPDARVLTFGEAGDYRCDGVELLGPQGPFLGVSELGRSLPHDLSNALAAVATAVAAGGDLAAARDVLRSFTGLPHRVELVATLDGVDYYDDSKATVPHAAVAAASAFDSVVLICGGRNKGLDLAPLRQAAGHLRAVVAIGEAADDLRDLFATDTPFTAADSMEAAVTAATDHASEGDVVLLSPACASFDWYGSYGERGEDFQRCVRALASSTEQR